MRGGTHVTHVVNQLCKHIATVLEKKNKGGAPVKPSQIKNHLFVFVNSLIENPGFDSQTKETLTTPMKDFGSRCNLSEKFLKQGTPSVTTCD
jgi:DNA topoisomerase-2